MINVLFLDDPFGDGGQSWIRRSEGFTQNVTSPLFSTSVQNRYGINIEEYAGVSSVKCLIKKRKFRKKHEIMF